ncbi:MAG: hypothetical protein ACXVB0_00170 [Mucilaginibacter sp.]
MGKFASVPALSLADVVDLVALSILDVNSAVRDLTIITQSFSHGPTIPAPIKDVKSSITAAINAAQSEIIYMFNAEYPFVVLPATSVDYGAVMSYIPHGNIQTLTDTITTDLSNWGQHPELAGQIAALVQPKVDNSALTPSVTYGVLSTNNPDNPSENLYWVACFAVFATGTLPPTYDVIYGFGAATYPQTNS